MYARQAIWRRWLLLVGLVVLAAAPAPAADARKLHVPAAGAVRPRAFASCANLVAYARRHFAVTHGVPEPPLTGFAEQTLPPRVPLAGGQVPAAAAPGGSTTFSTTNVQEQGVDESDIVKTDGTTVFAVSQGALYAVAAGASPRLVGSLGLGSNGYGAQLLLRGSRLIVISGGGALPVGVGFRVGAPGAAIAPSPYYDGGKTVITEVDVHDPSAMKVTRTMTVEGAFVDARQNGATARIVISSAPRAIAEATVRRQARGWVPTRTFHSFLTGRRYVRLVAACRTIARPAEFSGLGMLTILTLDLDRGLWTAGSNALMADAQVVYGSQNSLYVATQRWIAPATGVNQLPASPTTVIDRFDATSPKATPFVASGEVPGYLLNQFSLSEQNGYLRVASTSRPVWWGGGRPRSVSQSYVTVLATRGGLLVPVGQVAGLGAGQQIYSVRFVGDTGYVVTFRQVDPLYTIDLTSPTAPRVAGQLELQGYSAYLHPVAPGLLLGIGVDVAGGNEPAGSQLELFDVSNPAAPKLLARTSLGSGSSSQVQYDHHAFLFWPATGLVVIPVDIYSQPPGPPLPLAGGPGATSTQPPGTDFVGAIGFHIDGSGIGEVGRITHDPIAGYVPQIQRSVVIGNRVFTISDGGVMASSLNTLARQAFVPFPAPAPVPGAGSSSGSAGSSTGSVPPAQP